MSRRRPSPLATALLTGALAAMLASAGPRAGAQDVPGFDSSLMLPRLDGNPQNQPRFRRGKRPDADVSRFGEVQNFQYRPAFGVGATGFDSSGARRKRKAAGKAKAKSAAAPPTAAARGSATPDDTAPAAALAAPPVLPLANARQPRKQGGPAVQLLPVEATILTAPVALQRTRRALLLEEAPFAPLGVQVGSFLLRPAIDVTRGYDTNAPRTMPAQSSWYSVVAPELQVNSNWARHELTANLRGSYTSYDTIPSNNRPSVDAKVNGRIDVTSLTRIDLEGRFILGTDSPGSPNIQADLAWFPIFTTIGGSAGIGQRFNRFEVVAKGGVDRTVYQDSHFVDGSTETNDDRNYVQYSTQLRTSYDLMPGVKPFVEINADKRRHDVEPDRYGYYRNSDGLTGKAGSTFELSRLLTGEAAVGYLTRSYQDPTLPRLSGLLIDAALVWTASALTTAKLTATTRADETTVAGVSGIFTREVALQVDHAFRRWLLGTAKFSRAVDVYDGSPRVDLRYLASAALVYMLNRDWQLKSEIRQEWRNSNQPGNNYTSTVYLLGVRWQR